MDERQQARTIADRWLQGIMNSLVEMVPGEPDCEACILARQYMRALDKINRMTSLVERISPSQYNSFLKAELADKWPDAIQ